MPLTRRDLILTATAAALPSVLLKASNAPAAAAGEGGAAAPRWSLPPKRPFKIVENEWITLKDGTRLAARLWIPDRRGGAKRPVVYEYLPYRSATTRAARTTPRARSWPNMGSAMCGSTSAAPAIRTGFMRGEYDETGAGGRGSKSSNGWPSSRGRTARSGMRGISWGGFNSLADRGAGAAAAQGHHAGLLHGQSVHRRRSLLWRGAVQSEFLLGRHVSKRAGRSAGPRYRRRWLA